MIVKAGAGLGGWRACGFREDWLACGRCIWHRFDSTSVPASLSAGTWRERSAWNGPFIVARSSRHVSPPPLLRGGGRVDISIVAAVPTVRPRSESPYSPSRAIPSQFAQAGLSLNGKATPGTVALPQDSKGRPLGRVPDGRYAVRPGEVWLISTYSPRSWDSRYIGPVPASTIVSALRPVWIFAAHAR